MTADQPIRANSEGDPCPPWCTDHHPDAEIHRTARADFGISESGVFSWIDVKGINYCRGDAPEVSISGWHHVIATRKVDTPHLDLSPESARQIAGLIEILADATPEQHRELAAAIRRAAAQITEAQ